MAKKISIMWFRQDLRLRDNPALAAACERGTVIPVYIYDTHNMGEFALGGASQWWLHHSLQSLNKSLASKLTVLQGDPLALLQALIEKTGATSIMWNRTYEPWQIKRDQVIKASLQEQGIEATSFNGSLLWEPWKILNKSGSVYKVFTPYYRKGCLPFSSPRSVISAPAKPVWQYVASLDEGIDSLRLISAIDWCKNIARQWFPGEEGAAKNLQVFLSNKIENYKAARDIPSLAGTSSLSPHLHFGEISPNQVWYAALGKYHGSMDNTGLDCFLSEMGWREFSYYLLYHFPELPKQNFNQKFDEYPWTSDADKLKAWQQGKTGVPLIDAGMRELWQTGYMHNRVRMVVASYLVKNLGLHWHHGEAWFWDCLVDADLAANSAGWQWVAGSGADASPFFRIFNPVLQGEKFDKDGEYVRQYCPELKGLPNKYIHKPWEAPTDVLENAAITLGKTYPKPLVDLKESRADALSAYEAVKTA